MALIVFTLVLQLFLPQHLSAYLDWHQFLVDPQAEDAKWEAKLDLVIGSIEIPEPMGIETFLTKILSAISDFKFDISKDVEGTVQLRLANTTLRDVLDTALTQRGFTWRREGDTIFVSPAVQSRVFPLTDVQLNRVKPMLEDPASLNQSELALRRILFEQPNQEEIPGREVFLNEETRTLTVSDTEEVIATLESWLASVRDADLTPETDAEDARWEAKLDQMIGSFEVPQPTNIETVLTGILGALSGFDFVLAEGVKGKVEARLSNKTLREVLDILLKPNGFAWKRDGNRILVTAAKVQTRVFPLTSEQFDRAQELLENPDLDFRMIIFEEQDAEQIPGRELRLNERTHTLIVRDTEKNIAKAEVWVAMLEDIVTGDGLVYWSITVHPEIAGEAYELARRHLVEEVGGGEEAYQQAGKKVSLNGKTGALVILDTPENIESVKRIILAKPVSKRGILKARLFRITEDTATDPVSVRKRLQLLKDVVDELRILLYEREGETEEKANARGRRIFYPENEEQEQRDPRFIGTITVVDTSENLDRVNRYLAERDTRISIEARILILSSSLLDDLGISGDWSLFSPTRLGKFFNSVSTDENAEVLSCPKITARDGQNASISIPLKGPGVSTISLETRGDDEPISQNFEIEWPPLHYLEWVGTGQYRVVAVEKDDLPAIVLSATPVIIEESVFLDLELQVKELKRRLPLPDAPDLHAGRPIFETHTISTKLKMKNRETAVASLFNQKDSHGNEFTTVIAITVKVLPGKRLTRAPTSARVFGPGSSAGDDSR